MTNDEATPDNYLLACTKIAEAIELLKPDWGYVVIADLILVEKSIAHYSLSAEVLWVLQ